jgi:hypothetical protein
MGVNFSQAARDVARKIGNSPSALVRQEVAQIRKVLQPEASRDATGPAAIVLRRIEGRARKALPRIECLEKQLENSVNRAMVGRRLREAVDQLLRDIAMDWLPLRMELSQTPGTLAHLQDKLPNWMKNYIALAKERQGLPVAGGALRPFNLENTTGNRPEPNFRGEVVPHHALPERQREGLRPDGLEWVFRF